MIVHQLAEQVGLSGPLTSNTRVGEAVELFLSTQTWASPRTRVNRQGLLAVAFLPQFADLPIASLRPLDLARYLGERRNRLSPGSYHCEEGLIKQIFRWAKENLMIPVDPAQHFHSPRGASNKHQCLSWQKELRLLEALRTYRAPSRAEFLLCRDTGMRVSNALGLRREQLDFEHSTVSFTCLKSKVELVLPWTQRLRKALALFEALPSGASLFPHRALIQGRIYTNAGDLFLRVSAKVGFSVSSHDMRHTFFTRFHEALHDHLLTNYVLGHSMQAHVDTTYWHPPSPEGLREAFEKFETYQTEKLRQAAPLPDLSSAEMWRELVKKEKEDAHG